MPLQFSSHPVWEIFQDLNIPPEIINKILSFNTVIYSPIFQTVGELTNIRDFFEKSRLEAPFNSLVATFTTLCFDYDDYDMEEHVTTYIYKFNHHLYTINDPVKILEIFVETTYYSVCPNFDIIKGLLAQSLFYLMRCAYYDKIYFAFEPSDKKNNIDLTYHNLIQHKTFDNWKSRLNYMIFTQILFNKFGMQRSVSKQNLIGYCKLYGINHYKSWSKKKLYHTLITNEPTKFDDKYLEQCCT